MSASGGTKVKRITNPRIIGPGAWFCIHTMAMSCEDRESCLFFIQFVKSIVESFSCLECREHGKLYIDKNPPENYINLTNDIGEHIGMFKWSCEFHNYANKGLKKPKISFSAAWELYTESDICLEDCDKEEEDEDIRLGPHDILPPARSDGKASITGTPYLVSKGSTPMRPTPSYNQSTPTYTQQPQTPSNNYRAGVL